jgi:DICT domain-containing protein
MSSNRLTALALAATVLVAGCGGSKTLTRSQLAAKAEPICAHIQEKLGAVFSAKSPQSVSHAAAEFAAYDRQATAELAKLSPPGSMASDWKAIVTGYEVAGSAVAKLGQDAIPTKDKPGSGDVTAFTDAQHNRTVTAQRNGFNHCAQ